MAERKLGISKVKLVDNYYNYNLRSVRIEAGYSQKELASLVGVSIPLICAYERLRALPNSEIAGRLAEVLQKKVDELFPDKLRDHAKEIRSERYGNLRNLKNVLNYGITLPRTIENKIKISEEQTPESIVSRKFLEQKMAEVVKTLPYIDREIIKLRFGLGDGYSYTLKEVSSIFHIREERVRMIEAKAIRELQHPLRSKKLVGFLDER